MRSVSELGEKYSFPARSRERRKDVYLVITQRLLLKSFDWLTGSGPIARDYSKGFGHCELVTVGGDRAAA